MYQSKTNDIESEPLAVFRLDYKRAGCVFIQGLFSIPYYFAYPKHLWQKISSKVIITNKFSIKNKILYRNCILNGEKTGFILFYR